MKEQTAGPLEKILGGSIVIAVIMIILGVLAIAVPHITGITFSIFFGWIILITGVSHFFDAFAARGAGGFIWRMLVSIAYLVGGIYLIFNPGIALEGLTFAVAVIFILEGIFRMIAGFASWMLPGSGWVLLDGIVSTLLGVLIGYNWPGSSGWALGTIIGVNLLSSGFTRLMVSSLARSAVNAVSH